MKKAQANIERAILNRDDAAQLAAFRAHVSEAHNLLDAAGVPHRGAGVHIRVRSLLARLEHHETAMRRALQLMAQAETGAAMVVLAEAVGDEAERHDRN